MARSHNLKSGALARSASAMDVPIFEIGDDDGHVCRMLMERQIIRHEHGCTAHLSIFQAGRSVYPFKQRSDAPPPAKLRVSGDPLLLPREARQNSGTPPPSRCSTLSKSLPYLLPRQAFSVVHPIKLSGQVL
jgi:hypothetical protein